MKEGGRARRPEDKEQRRTQLKDAAARLLDAGRPLSELTIAEVAAEAGVAKGTTYTYFATREALLLAVLQDDLGEWFRALVPALTPPLTPAESASRLAGSLLARPRLLGLLSALHSVLEANLDPESARGFKAFLARALVAAESLRGGLPGIPEGEVARFLLRVHALVVGLVGMANPPPVLAAVLDEPGLTWLRVDLSTELPAAIAALLRGSSPAGA